MNEHRLSDEALQEAFQSRPVPRAHACTTRDLDCIRRALDGDLPGADRRRLVERLSVEPALAEAWRTAHRLRRTPPVQGRAVAHGRWWLQPASWAGAAAAALAIVAVTLPRSGTGESTLRDAAAYAIESRLADETVLPRDAFRLRWKPGPQDSRYQVRVTTEELRLLSAVADLSEPELVVDPATLASVPAGARVFWQVEALSPDGERIVSPTFVVRVQ